MKAGLLFFLFLASLCCLISSTASGACIVARLFKALTSVLFILTAAAGYKKNKGSGHYFWLIMMGLVFSLFGDICLSLTEYKYFFEAGFCSFFAAQLFYVLAFSVLSKIKRRDFLVMLIFCIPALGVIYLLKGFVFDGMLPLVTGYTLVISFMCAKAVSLKNADGVGRTAFILTAAGAILFFISDFVLLFDLFYVVKPSALCYINLITYYIGQGLIALSLALGISGNHSAEPPAYKKKIEISSHAE